MASDPAFVDYVLEQAGLGARLSTRRMFGEVGLYLDETFIAMVCDDSLFVKPTAAVEHCGVELPMRPPYPQARPHPVADELLDDSEALQALLLETARLLPAKPRARKRR